MLKLTKITKDYVVADTVVHALKGIDISFRKNEFVSILGPSGCGKTTLLNIIGGLDHYTSGDLFIDNISTRDFKDGDWDTYRNHRIGFVFQSYNLIPHQTVLENVELALTIGGVSKEERIKRAKAALDKVGLSDQYNKKPNQLSGGQCQRVAIARALVNEPDILLADEPTGALDTKTSIQIMELIKEISKDRLVIMVTHNPELATQYSTRIINLLDGRITSDSNPYDYEVKKYEVKQKEKKSKLSFWTGFKLSARNLKSKFKRTAMVCFAGSIGIIGVATVLSVSTGVTNYVNKMQDDMLSGNPITIKEQTMSFDLLLEGMEAGQKNQLIKDSIEDGKVNVQFLINTLVERNKLTENMMISNDITQEYIDYLYEMPSEYYSAIATYYGINVRNNIYTDVDIEKYGKKNMSLTAIENMYTNMLKETELKDYASIISQVTNSFEQYPNNIDFIKSQYDIISDAETSYFATEANELMIVVSDDTELTDILLGQLGYYTQNEFFNISYKASESEKYDSSLDKAKFTYEELLGKTFKYYPNNAIYTKNINSTDYTKPLSSTNPFFYSGYENETWDDGIEFKITAILRAKDDISYGCLNSGVYYTPEFTKRVILDNLESEICQYASSIDGNTITSMAYTDPNSGTTISYGITYNLDYSFENRDYNDITCYVGASSMLGALLGNNSYTITLRELGGINLPNELAIYPYDFEYKDDVTSYLDQWNSEGDVVVNGVTITAENRNDIIYTDTLAIVISLVTTMIDIVTYALVAFTALSLVVSTVMIAIITYVSVIERVKEIGVIRSLGGRKKDVSRLFNSESFIIGGLSGVVGIAVTYLLSGLINLIVGSLSGIYTIATLPISAAIIMIIISILLTSISGLVPARIASKKDPVVALRTE